MIGVTVAFLLASPASAAVDLCRSYSGTDRDAFCDGYVMATVDQMEARWSTACVDRIRAIGLAEARRRLSRLWGADPSYGQVPLAWSVEGGLLRIGGCDPAGDRKR